MRYFIFLFILISGFCNALDVNKDIPQRAYQYLPTVKQETTNLIPNLPTTGYFGALIEHESCISLTHSRCWSPSSRLKTDREEGIGFGQLTRTWKKDGSIRFDVVSELSRKYTVLKDLNWSNIRERPDLQIKAIILLWNEGYKNLYQVKDDSLRVHFADAAYNGGRGDVNRERTICGLKKDCDPQVWFGNVETTCVKSTKALYGNRSPCDINRHHVKDVIKTRLPKYRIYMLKN